MSEREFDADVIIVGGGLAGCSAAIVLANAGLSVIVIERGDYCGAKNMTGGRLYGHSLEKLFQISKKKLRSRELSNMRKFLL